VTPFARRAPMDIQEPEIKVEEILRIDDPSFNGGMVLTY
jgi:hypothetical protein